MVSTLKSIGVSETEFLKECNATFKQGSKFVGWDYDQGQGSYYHPFDDLKHSVDGVYAEYWSNEHTNDPFSKLFSVQHEICQKNLAPKMITDAEYQSSTNYGYHLDANLFSTFLQKHCVKKLGVNHVIAEVKQVNQDSANNIVSVSLDTDVELAGDLYQLI